MKAQDYITTYKFILTKSYQAKQSINMLLILNTRAVVGMCWRERSSPNKVKTNDTAWPRALLKKDNKWAAQERKNLMAWMFNLLASSACL